MKSYFILILLMVLSLTVKSQTGKKPPLKDSKKVAVRDSVKSDLMLKAKGYDTKIVLRWAINNPVVWPFFQKAGVWIDRAVLDENNKLKDKKWVRLNQQPVKPWTAAYFQKPGVLDLKNKNLLIAAQALYGDLGVRVTSEKQMDSIKLASSAYENNFTLALMAADFSSQAANALGLRYEDTLKVNKAYKYAYRIYTAADHPLFKVDTAFYLYAGYVKDEVYAPRSVQARGKDGLIEIYWPKKDLYNSYTSYNVERSADGKKFSRLNKLSLVYSKSDTTTTDFIFADSVQNYKKWYYRINGIDAFGDTSYYCPTVSAMARNLAPPPTAYLSAQAGPSGTVVLRWKQEETAGRPVSGFIVRRGRSMTVLDEAAHKQVLPKQTRTFTDTPGKLEKGVYYQLISIDTAGNYSFSNIPFIFKNDTIPPKPPIGLAGTIDSLGKVKLSWKLDYSDNVYAYRVFVSNNPNQTFSPVNVDLVRDTTFTDRINFSLLNKKIYYKIVAIDGNNNHSSFSDILVLDRPKVNPSPAPVISNYKVEKNAVQLNFGILPEEDLLQIHILRRIAGDTIWTNIAKLPKTNRSYRDSTVLAGLTYQYAVQTADLHQQKSRLSFPLQVYVYKSGPKSVLSDVIMQQDENNSIKINWKISGDAPAFYIIYKDKGKGLLQYKSAGAGILLFKDTQIGNIQNLRYAVKAVYLDQTESPVVIALKN